MEKLNTESNTRTKTNLTQTAHKTNTNKAVELSFETLVGNFKKIILYVYNQCKFNGTYEIILSITSVATATRIPVGSVNTTLVRLEEKGVIQKIKSRAGRGGWKQIKLAEHIYRQILYRETSHKFDTNPTQTTHNHHTEPNTKPDTCSPSSSYIYKTTTTDPSNLSDSRPQLSYEWQNLDIEPLSDIGFTITHLFQIASQNKLSAKIIQDSIYAFVFDLQENNKAKSIKGDPINFFMGILRKGVAYNFPSNYESPQNKALRKTLEAKKKQQQKKENMLDELTNIEFSTWKQDLKEEEIEKIVPEDIRKLSLKSATTSSLKTHFREKILFPRLKKEGLLE